MRLGNPFRTIGFRIELGKLIAFSIVLIFLLTIYPNGYFLYIMQGIVVVIGIFSFLFYSLVDINEKKKYLPDQIRYLKLMVIIFMSLALISLGFAIYDRYLGLVGGITGEYFTELIIVMFVCLVVSISAYSGLRQTGNDFFVKNL